MTPRTDDEVRLLVIQYHRIGPPCAKEYPGMSVTPEVFAKQIDWLRRNGFQTITPSQWSAARSSGAALPSKPAMLMFDDGYKDLSAHAFPLLESAGMSSAVAIVTSEIGGTNRWDIGKGFEEQKLLSDDEICYWKDHGVEFVSHTHTHADLSTLSDDEIEDELSESKIALKQLTQRPVTSLVYPYAQVSESVARIAEKHYELAFSGIPGVNSLATPRCLQRRVAAPVSVARFRWVIASAGWSAYHRVREAIHRGTR